ncbi:hypothetical protein [Tsukamurella tyrosinosolvens]|uniref:hypothetical protein n=1 Tax=Tsukamurella tyrosinosolvens TaxID=57704 RepID=UPI001930E5C8|nr:hypothetical protein [Tsukamurella tyrosinosolvens]
MSDETFDEAVEGVLARFLPGACAALEVGRGWYSIIVDLDRDLGAIDPDYQLVQVKEKFGGLRYYVEPEPDKARPGFSELIRGAERMAERTCEEPATRYKRPRVSLCATSVRTIWQSPAHACDSPRNALIPVRPS